MGIWSTIGEAAATMNDDKESAARFNEARTGPAKAELETNTKRLFDNLHALQARKVALNPQSPTYQKDAAAIDADIQTANTTFHDMYHPMKNPGALQHLGGFIQKHLHKQPAAKPVNVPVGTGGVAQVAPPQKVPKTAGEAKQSLAQTLSHLDQSAATPPPRENPELEFVTQLEAAGVSHEDAMKAEKVRRGIEGKPGVVKPEPPPGSPAAEPKPVKQTADERTRADFAEFKKTHPKYEGTFERWRKEQGTLPKTPGPVKPDRLSATQNKAQSGILEAKKLSKIADLVAEHPDDAVNQKRLAVALERISAGRFTTQALDYIVKSGIANSIEGWANNASTGALPKDVIRQLVEGAHQNEEAAQYALDEAMKLPVNVPRTAGEAKKAMKGTSPSQPIVVSPEDMK